MSFKSKLFGFGAASILALSITGGAMAKPHNNPDSGSKTVDVNVTLNERVCEFTADPSVGAFSDVDLVGSNNRSHSEASMSASTKNTMRESRRNPNNCNVGVRADDLTTGGRYNKKTLRNARMTINDDSSNIIGRGYTHWFTAPQGEASTDGTLNLSVPNDADPGTYSTTIYFQISSGRG